MRKARGKRTTKDRKSYPVGLWQTRLSHLWLIERKGRPREDVRRPTDEQLFYLIDLAVHAGGIDVLRAWLDDVERLVKPKRDSMVANTRTPILC